MDRFETHGMREEKPLYERLLALPGQAILVGAALPVLAPVLIVRGVMRMTAAAKARRAERARTAQARAAAPAAWRHADEFAHA